MAFIVALQLLALGCIVDAQFNRECYYAPNKKAGSAIIPCTDPSRGITWCCQNGDICLSDLACWNPKTNVTYQYGCTDSMYEHDNCPKKCNLDMEKSPWVGLIYCREKGNLWACHHPDTCGNCSSPNKWPPSIIELPKHPQGCPDLGTVTAAFAGPTALLPSVSLPANNAGTETLYFSPTGTSFAPQSGYTPSWATGTSSVDPPASVHTSTPANDSDNDKNATSVSASNGGLSPGAKTGIGVGVSIPVLILAALALVFVLRKRQRQSRATLTADSAARTTPPLASDSAQWYSPHHNPSMHNAMEKAELETPANSPRPDSFATHTTVSNLDSQFAPARPSGVPGAGNGGGEVGTYAAGRGGAGGEAAELAGQEVYHPPRGSAGWAHELPGDDLPEVRTGS